MLSILMSILVASSDMWDQAWTRFTFNI